MLQVVIVKFADARAGKKNRLGVSEAAKVGVSVVV